MEKCRCSQWKGSTPAHNFNFEYRPYVRESWAPVQIVEWWCLGRYYIYNDTQYAHERTKRRNRTNIKMNSNTRKKAHRERETNSIQNVMCFDWLGWVTKRFCFLSSFSFSLFSDNFAINFIQYDSLRVQALTIAESITNFRLDEMVNQQISTGEGIFIWAFLFLRCIVVVFDVLVDVVAVDVVVDCFRVSCFSVFFFFFQHWIGERALWETIFVLFFFWLFSWVVSLLSSTEKNKCITNTQQILSVSLCCYP